MNHPLPEKMNVEKWSALSEIDLVKYKINALIDYLKETEDSKKIPLPSEIDWSKCESTDTKYEPNCTCEHTRFEGIVSTEGCEIHGKTISNRDLYIQSYEEGYKDGKIDTQQATDKAYAAGHKEGRKWGLKDGAEEGRKEEQERMKLQWIKIKKEIHAKFENMGYKVSDLLNQLQ